MCSDLKVKPISPQEAKIRKCASIPDEVIEAFNTLIVENYKYSTKSSKVIQDDVLRIVCAKLNMSRSEIFDRGWLDIEPIFRKEGWHVKYNKSTYCDYDKSYFMFSEDIIKI